MNSTSLILFLTIICAQTPDRTASSLSKTFEASQNKQENDQPQVTDRLEFKDEAGGKATTTDGNAFSFHSYTSNDGVKLLASIEMFKSARLAKRALDERLKEATSVSSSGPKLGKNGQRIGERVVLTVQKKTQGEGESQSFVCWTIGSSLHCIQSKSLKHALAFEKTLDP